MRRTFFFGLVAMVSLMAGIATAASAGHEHARAAVAGDGYVVHNLVSDQTGVADKLDPNLVNAWGLTALPASPWWVADNGTDKTTVYQADGTAFPTASPIVVGVPSAPTGAVANPGSSFVVSSSTASGPALFLFATEEGKILGWNRTVSPTQAMVAVDRSSSNAVFKGLAISGDELFAADFRNARVDVFNGSFQDVTPAGGFTDPTIPQGYAPFGIQSIGGNIFVTYAQQDADKKDDVSGQGHGFVDEFDATGKLLQRVASHGQLNSPWGLALAPSSFGRFGGDLLVGNFGDGRINAFTMHSDGNFTSAGALRTSDGQRVEVDGLWSLQFGMGGALNGPTDTLFFTAGPSGEMHGLFGTIRAG